MSFPCWPWPWQPSPVPPYEPERREMVATTDGREVILIRRPAVEQEQRQGQVARRGVEQTGSSPGS